MNKDMGEKIFEIGKSAIHEMQGIGASRAEILSGLLGFMMLIATKMKRGNEIEGAKLVSRAAHNEVQRLKEKADE